MRSIQLHSVETGLDQCARNPSLVPRGAKFGLLMNRASVDANLRPANDVLNDACPGQLSALFTPQHGLWGEQQANMIESPHTRDERTGIPVHSLYSETRRPTAEMLSNLDLFIVDLQDVGTRVYTFAWTVLNCLEACAEADVPVLLLDRPNPLGGETVEGPLLQESCLSFVGGAAIPMRHGLTLGELALLLNSELGISSNLQVVPVRGWRRSMMFCDLDRLWIPPSPNLPKFEAALAYPGQVLLEGTNVSEGRGTNTPFEVAGAPFIESEGFCQQLLSFSLPGVHFLPTRFTPTFDKWAGTSCGGVSLHVTNPYEFRPYRTGLATLSALWECNPDDLQWLPPPYEYETRQFPIDIISGSTQLRVTLSERKRSLRELFDNCEADERLWRKRTSDCRLYD